MSNRSGCPPAPNTRALRHHAGRDLRTAELARKGRDHQIPLLVLSELASPEPCSVSRLAGRNFNHTMRQLRDLPDTAFAIVAWSDQPSCHPHDLGRTFVTSEWVAGGLAAIPAADVEGYPRVLA
jgi:hypothetical protein